MTGFNMFGNDNIKHPNPNNFFSKVIGDIFDNVLTQFDAPDEPISKTFAFTDVLT